MASILKRGGRKSIQFVDDDGRTRRTFSLGKVNQRAAERIARLVDDLLSHRRCGVALSLEHSQLLESLDEPTREKLASAGLIDKPTKVYDAPSQIGPFVYAYIEARRDGRATGKHGDKPAAKLTLEHYERVRKDMIEFFGAGRALRNVAKSDVLEFRRWYERAGKAKNTINKRMQRAKQFFAAAIADGRLTENPFDGQDCEVRPNESRFEYFPPADVATLLDAIPCPQWRLVVCLCRFAGLRFCELWPIRWQDVNWDKGEIRIDSPKTGVRTIPIFGDIHDPLREVFEQAPEGSEHVLTRFKSKGNGNLRTQLHRYLTLAGLKPWGKPFQNMRSSFECDLVRAEPMHVVTRWMGHTEKTALKHYLRPIQDDLDNAAERRWMERRSTPKAESVPAS